MCQQPAAILSPPHEDTAGPSESRRDSFALECEKCQEMMKILDPAGSAERDEDDAGISFAAASCRTRASAEETGNTGFLMTPGSSCTAGPQLGFH